MNEQDMDGEEEEEDDDSASNAAEYENWKLRELGRIKKEKEAREELEKERNDTERRRNMTDQEISKEDAEKLKPKEKSKWNFMQKYYHKGAFFRTFDEKDEIQNNWDFNQPTLEDKHDKSILPEVMQVKDFGFSSRTKWTHLKKEDTSNFDSPWFDKNNAAVQKNKKRMAGTGAIKK